MLNIFNLKIFRFFGDLYAKIKKSSFVSGILCFFDNTIINFFRVKVSPLLKKLRSIVLRFPLIFSFFFGLFCHLSFIPYGSVVFLIIGFEFFVIILLDLFYKNAKMKGCLSGFMFGLGFYISSFWWLLSLQESGFDEGIQVFLGFLSCFGAAFFCSLMLSFFIFLAFKFAFNKISFLLYLSVFVTLTEICDRYVIELSPFILFGYGTAGMFYFPQIASIVGSYGVTFLVVFIISFLNVDEYRNKVIYLFLLCSAYGFYKINIKWNYTVPEKKFDIYVVQPNFSDEKRYNDHECSCDEFARMLGEDFYKNINRKTLVIAPETIIYSDLEQRKWFVGRCCGITKEGNTEEEKFISQDILREQRKYDYLDNLVVCTGFWQRCPNDVFYNSYQFFKKSRYSTKNGDFATLSKYNKRYLIPFGEIGPWWLWKLSTFIPKWFTGVWGYLNDLKRWEMTPGKCKNTIDISGISPFSMNICSDIINPGLSVDDAEKSTWILSTMNFHTFNDYESTSALAYYAKIWGMFRAIEFEKPVVMCINFGLSCVLDCNGRIVEDSGIGLKKSTILKNELEKDGKNTVITVEKNIARKELDPKKPGVIHQEMPLKYGVSIFSTLGGNRFIKTLLICILFTLFWFWYYFKKNKEGLSDGIA